MTTAIWRISDKLNILLNYLTVLVYTKTIIHLIVSG